MMALSKFRDSAGMHYSDLHGMLTFVYRNWKGQIRQRRVTPISMEFKENEFHDGPQWFLIAYCQDKKAPRDFALEDIIGPITHVVRRNNTARQTYEHEKAKHRARSYDPRDLVINERNQVEQKAIDHVPSNRRTDEGSET